MGYPSPIHPNKPATDDAYDMALRFCVDNYESIASCNASHNLESNLPGGTDPSKGLLRTPPFNFCQLYGMSDNITFNLAKGVQMWLSMFPTVRSRCGALPDPESWENSSITGDMSREFQLVQSEMKRRGWCD